MYNNENKNSDQAVEEQKIQLVSQALPQPSINTKIQKITNLNIVKKDNALVINNCDENNFKEKINTNDTTKSKYQTQIDKRKTDPKWKEYLKIYSKIRRQKIRDSKLL